MTIHYLHLNQPSTRLPRKLIRDAETVEIDNSSPSEHFRRGQLYFESRSFSSDWVHDEHNLYMLVDSAASGLLSAYRHLRGSEHAKELNLWKHHPIYEFDIWDNAPLHRLAFLYGDRFWPGMVVVAEALGMWELYEDVSIWFLNGWLPRADAVASEKRVLSRVHTRTKLTAHMVLPLMDEYRLKYLEILQRVVEQYPEYRGRIFNSSVLELMRI